MRALLLGIATSLFALCSPPAFAETLRIGITATVPPFASQDEAGELHGFNVDFVRAICQHLGWTCRFEVLKFPEVIPAVAAGRLELGVANILKTPERAQQVAFSRSYWRSTSSFVGARALDRFDRDKALAGQRFCAVRATRQDAWLTARLATPAQLIRLPGNAEVLAGLAQGRCALALLPTMQVLEFLKSPAGQAFAFAGLPLSEEGVGGDVHIVLRPDQPILREQVDQAIDALIRDGTHERLSRVYFSFSIL